jgi:kynurenine formamidase
MPQFRAQFDAEVTFVNGGGLSAQGFRIDLPAADVDEATIARLFVQSLGLALVGSVELSNLEIVEEAHKGTRGIPLVERVETTSSKAIDLSHVIREGLITYPGLPAPTIQSFLTWEDSRAKYAPGTEFAMDVITMIGNTGTYIDSPYHRYSGGGDLSSLSLDTLVNQPAEVFHLQDSLERGVAASVFFDRDVRGKAVLLHTGWDVHFGTDAYLKGSPFLTEEGAEYLVDQGATVVGIDALNMDDTESGGARPAHTRLLAAGIHVVEHLTNLGELPPTGALFTAAAPKVEGFGTFPVRAFATL